MPAADDPPSQDDSPSGLPFPPLTREHILHCSYHFWHPKYRTITPKARLIPLTQPFLEYLRADGIILPSDDQPEDWDSGVYSEDSDSDEDDDLDVAANWRDVHTAIQNTISELGGQVVPKLNWSAPKDATWMNANTMTCHNPNDIYLLLKSSDFVTHDLEHAYDDTVTSPTTTLTPETIPYHLVLRKAVPQWNPSVEFRCFVRNRRLLCICQRDLNHFEFLFSMTERLSSLIQEFFDVRLRDTFPDANYAFDVYVPPPYDRVWLVDINPWALRTDPLLFSWLEILNMPEPPNVDDFGPEPEFVRLSLNNDISSSASDELREKMRELAAQEDDEEEADEEIWLPELRLIRKTDPEAYSFNTPQYSAHKLPKDVVDASQSGEGLREFAQHWEEHLARRQREDDEQKASSDDD